jgi:cell wall-associated NlpC family hydrolase
LLNGGAKVLPSQLEPADLVFIRGNRWLDFPVKLVTNSQYTHVAGYVSKGRVIEAQGLRATGYEHVTTYAGVSDVYRCPRITLGQKQQVIRYVEKEIGGQYDYLLLGWEAWRHIFGFMLPYLKNKRRICSTLWADAYLQAGIDLCPNHRYPTPADLTHSKHLRKIGRL